MVAIAAITTTNNTIYTLGVTQQTFVQMNIMCAFLFSQFWVDLWGLYYLHDFFFELFVV